MCYLSVNSIQSLPVKTSKSSSLGLETYLGRYGQIIHSPHYQSLSQSLGCPNCQLQIFWESRGTAILVYSDYNHEHALLYRNKA